SLRQRSCHRLPGRPVARRTQPRGSHAGRARLFFGRIPPPPRSPLFPYTTLFRSLPLARRGRERGPRGGRRPPSLQGGPASLQSRSEEHTSELQSRRDLVCRLLLEKKKERLNRLQRDPLALCLWTGDGTTYRVDTP